jgi:hypothetical protein
LDVHHKKNPDNIRDFYFKNIYVNMPILNENIKSFKCLIRLSHFTKRDEDKDTYHNGYAFAVQSVPGKILTFHVMTDYGMLRSRVPISEIFLKEPKNDIVFHFKQLWDCFSEKLSIIEYDFLKGKRAEVVLKNKTKIWVTYLMTIDWYDNSYSDEPSDYKCGHILVSDDGYLLCQPNNRIFWKDSNWVTNKFPLELSEIKVDNNLKSVESSSDRWVSEDNDNYYYDITQN